MLRDEPDVKTFSWHMHVLATHFTVLSLSEAVERLRNNSLPARAVCITFDDGYAHNAIVALPVLRSCKISATFFIASGYLDGGIMWNDTVIETVRQAPGTMLDLRNLDLGNFQINNTENRYHTALALLSKLKYLPKEERDRQVSAITETAGVEVPRDIMMRSEQVRALSQSGMEIGAHTVSHPILAGLEDEQARFEIAAGKEHLTEIIGAPVRIFAYPNGKPGVDYDSRHVRMVKHLGFLGAVTTAWGTANRSTDIYQLPRFTPWDKSPTRFAFRLFSNCLRT
jgi:peptidoglycan/xylan/chitin deacetylase (PgdA/CDA1 family)